MPLSGNVTVIHANGAYSIARRARAERAIANGKAHWKDFSRCVLIMRRSTDDEPVKDREYGGKISFADRFTVEACDIRNRTIIRVPIEERDRTKTPIRHPGGAKVLQLKKLKNRRSNGRHITMPEDRLWRPDRNHRSLKNHPGPPTV